MVEESDRMKQNFEKGCLPHAMLGDKQLDGERVCLIEGWLS